MLGAIRDQFLGHLAQLTQISFDRREYQTIWTAVCGCSLAWQGAIPDKVAKLLGRLSQANPNRFPGEVQRRIDAAETLDDIQKPVDVASMGN
jgi:hypothetical protein